MYEEACAEVGRDFRSRHGGSNATALNLCPEFFDGLKCWSPAYNGTIERQPCFDGDVTGSDAQAFRVCHSSGRWLGEDGRPAVTVEKSYSNYTPCMPQYTADFVKNKSIAEIMMIDKAVRVNEILEIVGDVLSCLCLSSAIIIFYRCVCLRNLRTKIHRNLFLAMLMQTLVHLLLATKEILLTRTGKELREVLEGLKALPHICISFKCIWETTRTSIFAWMLIEGINIHNRIAVTVFQTDTSMLKNYILGYGLPVVPTMAWASVILWRREHGLNECWKESFFSPFYWILNSCRLLTFVINIGFLLNVLKVLVMRLRENRSNETQQMSKALRAAFLLLPMLGITNVICIVPDPVDTIYFIVVTSLKSFLLSFQGLFLALMYCFLDKEVQAALHRVFVRYRMRRGRIKRRQKAAAAAAAAAASVAAPLCELQAPAAAAPGGAMKQPPPQLPWLRQQFPEAMQPFLQQAAPSCQQLLNDSKCAITVADMAF